MTVAHELEAANAKYKEAFTAGSTLKPPAKNCAVITCMDARLHPEAFLGLNIGDAHMLRNAGGRVTGDVLRSLALSLHLLGSKEVFIIHHTNCGAMGFTNEGVRKAIKERLGPEAGAAAEDIDFGAFKDLEESVHTDMGLVKASPLVPDDVLVHGYIYDVMSGGLTL